MLGEAGVHVGFSILGLSLLWRLKYNQKRQTVMGRSVSQLRVK